MLPGDATVTMSWPSSIGSAQLIDLPHLPSVDLKGRQLASKPVFCVEAHKVAVKVFHGGLRDQKLDRGMLPILGEERAVLDQRHIAYNNRWPHGGLNQMTPAPGSKSNARSSTPREACASTLYIHDQNTLHQQLSQHWR